MKHIIILNYIIFLKIIGVVNMSVS